MSKHLTLVVAMGLLVATASPALAIAVRSPKGGIGPSAKVIDAPAASAAAAPSMDLARGRIEAVDPSKRQLVIAGRKVEWHASKLRIIAAGGHGQASTSALRKGAQIRFALDPNSTAVDRPIVLIYIDQP
ncbi:MAG: hypothetical protein IPP44_30320 [Ideonella sp.]|nr:hypothetical protein [Ideonella sp.]